MSIFGDLKARTGIKPADNLSPDEKFSRYCQNIGFYYNNAGTQHNQSQ